MTSYLSVQKRILNQSKTAGEKLCDALEGMGTTFIKLGQFLATRPDIIGKELANDLEKLQDKLPPFKYEEAETILKEVGENQFKQISNFSEPSLPHLFLKFICKINLKEKKRNCS